MGVDELNKVIIKDRKQNWYEYWAKRHCNIYKSGKLEGNNKKIETEHPGVGKQSKHKTQQHSLFPGS